MACKRHKREESADKLPKIRVLGDRGMPLIFAGGRCAVGIARSSGTCIVLGCLILALRLH